METTVFGIEQGDLIALLEIARVALNKWERTVGEELDLSHDELNTSTRRG